MAKDIIHLNYIRDYSTQEAKYVHTSKCGIKRCMSLFSVTHNYRGTLKFKTLMSGIWYELQFLGNSTSKLQKLEVGSGVEDCEHVKEHPFSLAVKMQLAYTVFAGLFWRSLPLCSCFGTYLCVCFMSVYFDCTGFVNQIHFILFDFDII